MAGKTIEESKRARKEATSKTSGKSPSPSSSGNKGKIPHTDHIYEHCSSPQV